MPKDLPGFKSEKEEAEFWDRQNTLDYIERDEPVEVELAPELAARIKEKSRMKRVTLRLRESQIEAAKRIAEKRDIPYQTLLRSWIAEAIRRDQAER